MSRQYLSPGEYSCPRTRNKRGLVEVSNNHVSCFDCLAGDCIDPVDQGISCCGVWVEAYSKMHKRHDFETINKARAKVRRRLYDELDQAAVF